MSTPRRLASLLVCFVVLALGCGLNAGPASAVGSPAAPASTTVTHTDTVTTTVAAGTPVLVTSQTKPPAGYRLSANQVLAIASRSPVVKAELRRHRHAVPYEYTKGYPEWQVSWFSDQKPARELIQVYVDDRTGKVTQSWTGFQVAWTMARGYHGAFGRDVNDWFIWIPMCLVFVGPVHSLAPAADAAASGSADAARLLDFAGVLQPRQDRDLGPARLSVPALSVGANAGARTGQGHPA